jgi:hypothetical protein
VGRASVLPETGCNLPRVMTKRNGQLRLGGNLPRICMTFNSATEWHRPADPAEGLPFCPLFDGAFRVLFEFSVEASKIKPANNNVSQS